MQTGLALSLLLITVIVAGGAVLYWRQRSRILVLDKKIEEMRAQKEEMEERHGHKEAQWEITEEKLRSFLQLMDTLMNTIPNPIYFKDTEGFFQGCNKVFAKQILGLTRDRIIGKRPQELTEQIPPDLTGVYQREERIMTEKAGFHTHEAQVLCHDGQRRDFLFNLAPVKDSQGQISGSVAVLSDLTDKNRAARNQIQKEKLESVLETAGAVCHELNQPLQTLSGYTELVAMTIDDEDVAGNIEKIVDQVERIHNITKKLQQITRYETTDYSDRTKIIDIEKASQAT
jgi:PAS domain S-box-containing protein